MTSSLFFSFKSQHHNACAFLPLNCNSDCVSKASDKEPVSHTIGRSNLLYLDISFNSGNEGEDNNKQHASSLALFASN